MKLYAVELTTTAVVVADSGADAWQVARDNIWDIVNDADPDICATGAVTNISDLPEGWDGMCIPYGYDGNTRIQEILEEEASRC